LTNEVLVKEVGFKFLPPNDIIMSTEKWHDELYTILEFLMVFSKNESFYVGNDFTIKIHVRNPLYYKILEIANRHDKPYRLNVITEWREGEFPTDIIELLHESNVLVKDINNMIDLKRLKEPIMYKAIIKIINNEEEKSKMPENKILQGSPRTHVEASNFTFNAYHTFTIKSEEGKELGVLNFQDGPIAENGVNGVTNEDLLAIVIERIENFQDSEFSCRENALALTNIQQGLMWLQDRTRKRQARGVEGTQKV
jgi:hypothetical protein